MQSEQIYRPYSAYPMGLLINHEKRAKKFCCKSLCTSGKHKKEKRNEKRLHVITTVPELWVYIRKQDNVRQYIPPTEYRHFDLLFYDFVHFQRKCSKENVSMNEFVSVFVLPCICVVNAVIVLHEQRCLQCREERIYLLLQDRLIGCISCSHSLYIVCSNINIYIFIHQNFW